MIQGVWVTATNYRDQLACRAKTEPAKVVKNAKKIVDRWFQSQALIEANLILSDEVPPTEFFW